MSKASAAKKIDPFKTKKNKTPASKTDDTVTPPAKVAKAIDEFREAQDQYKHFEGEMTIYKDQILAYTNEEYSKRAMNGIKSSVKVLGEEAMVTYVVMDASAGLTEEEVTEFSERWGEKAAKELIVKDYGGVRFD